jgi:hypothetical protein
MEGVVMCSIFLVVTIAFSPLCVSLPITGMTSTQSSAHGASSKTILQTAIEKWKQTKCDVLPKKVELLLASGGGGGGGDVTTSSDYSWLQYCNISASAAVSNQQMWSKTLCQTLSNVSSEICLDAGSNKEMITSVTKSVLFMLQDKTDICEHFGDLNKATRSSESEADPNLAKKLGAFELKHNRVLQPLLTFECSSFCKDNAVNACKSLYILTVVTVGYRYPLKFKGIYQKFER